MNQLGRDVLTPEQLAALQRRRLPRCTWQDLFVSPNLRLTDTVPLSNYFRRFLSPADDMACVCCGTRLTGSAVETALGLCSFRWGIVHGEGSCSRCGYPGRALHYDVGPIRRMNYVLQYHPDELAIANKMPDTESHRA